MFPFEFARFRPLRSHPNRKWMSCLLAGALLVAWVPGAVAQDSNLTAVEALIRQAKFADADRQLQVILQKQPNNARAIALLGTVRRQQGNWPEAESLFRRAVAANPPQCRSRRRTAIFESACG